MKRTLAILLFFSGIALSLSAAHIRGGEIYYEYKGVGNQANSSRYKITLKLYIDCSQNNPGQLNNEAPITIFYKATNVQYGSPVIAPLSDERFIRYDPNSNPCITNPPTDVCYRLRFYEITIELPNDPTGYIISYQRCCRIQGIQNIQPPSNDLGATYLCEIPGTNVLADAQQNSSPLFTTNDAVAICVGSTFTFDFSAVDPDGTDSLFYQLCNAFEGGGPSNGGDCFTCPTPNPAAPPPYQNVPYRSPYAGLRPMGSTVTINSQTGLISGTAPTSLGQYVVTACVSEYRRGVLINTHRKDIHIKVSDCMPLKAQLKPDYSYCDDFLVSFKNEQINPTGSVYIWDFGDNTPTDTSMDLEGRIPHQYADTGTYRVKVKVILAGQCVDSTFTNARVYPGFYPGFLSIGSCKFTPFQFLDTTKSRYGKASRWNWNFGDESTNADTSKAERPSWLYNTFGVKQVQLIVQSDKGCIDTVYSQVDVRDKPLLTLPFKDTLICSVDTLQLTASGSGSFSWTPGININNTNTSSPLVYPKSTTTYTVTLNENGCVATDDIKVRVVDFVSLYAGNDTTICSTDTLQLTPVSDGLQYTWSPAAFVNNASTKSPLAFPDVTTTYTVEARIGKCTAQDAVRVRTVPYPISNAGVDTTICFEDTASLNGSIVGSSFSWNPVSSLSSGSVLNPFAFPGITTSYTLRAFDTLGCPKPGIDQILITVRPKINAFAGNDTAVVTGQPLQLNGSGAQLYQWQPTVGLNQTNISNPVATLENNMTYFMQTFTPEGCLAYDTINIKVFKTQPDIFVPNAFVPQGKNNTLKPIPVGISSLDYFRVYNRWGQLVFQTKQLGKGWDGRIAGILQNNGAYVWMVSGKDYTGRTVVKKGTALLIR